MPEIDAAEATTPWQRTGDWVTRACRRWGCWINPHTGRCNRCGREA